MKMAQHRQVMPMNMKYDDQKLVDDDIDLKEIMRLIVRRKFFIAAFTTGITTVAVVISLWLPNIYRSQALLAPSSQDAKGLASQVGGQFGGIAQLAGLDLGGSAVDNVTMTLEVMKSRQFIIRFIKKHDLLVPLFSAKGWDWKKNELILDADVYDTVNKKWVRDVSPPKTVKPSDMESYEKFLEIYSVGQDKKTGMVNVSIEFLSPVMAKQWVDWLVKDINAFKMDKDITEAERGNKYLTSKLQAGDNVTINTILKNLIEQNMKVILLAKMKDEYFFETIDRAMIAEEKIKPRRSIIVVLSFLGSLILAILFVLLVSFLKSEEHEAPTNA